jgi:hypothetical protein
MFKFDTNDILVALPDYPSILSLQIAQTNLGWSVIADSEIEPYHRTYEVGPIGNRSITNSKESVAWQGWVGRMEQIGSFDTLNFSIEGST